MYDYKKHVVEHIQNEQAKEKNQFIMRPSAIATLASLAAVSDAQGLFPDCVHGPLANTTVCNVNASMLARRLLLNDH